MNMNTLLQLTQSFVREPHIQQPRGRLFSSNHSYSDRCQAQRKGGYTIIPEVERLPFVIRFHSNQSTE